MHPASFFLDLTNPVLLRQRQVKEMAEIELGSVSDRLDEEELRELAVQLEKAGVRYDIHKEFASQRVAARLSEDAVTEFLDRLDAHEVAADIYLPVDFDGVLKVGDYRVASAQALSGALEELCEELGIEEEVDEEEEEDDDPSEDHLIATQLKNIWQLMNDACEESIDRLMPLHVQV